MTGSNSVAEAVVDHAGALDAVASGDVLMKGKLAFMERELEKGLANCEKNLTDAFSKVDALIGQLRADYNDTTAALAARTAQLEAGLASLQSSPPPGLQPPLEAVGEHWTPQCSCSANRSHFKDSSSHSTTGSCAT